MMSGDTSYADVLTLSQSLNTDQGHSDGGLPSPLILPRRPEGAQFE